MNETTKATDTPLVDTHFHVYTTDMPLTSWAWHHPPEDASAEQFVEVMDRHGAVSYTHLTLPTTERV